MWRVAAAALAIGAIGACSDDGRESNAPEREIHPPAPPAAAAPLSLSDVAVGPAFARRDGAVVIAGEPARVGFRIGGGRPPYRVAIEGPPLDASATVSPEGPGAAGVEAAARATIDPTTPSATYPLVMTATDAAGATAQAEVELTVVGEGERVRPAPKRPPWVEVVDVAGRRRAGFRRGERVTIRANLGGATGEYDLVLADPDGNALATQHSALAEGPVLEIPLGVPRLARPGRYTVTVELGRARARGGLDVVGEPYPPARELAIDRLWVWGGEDHRADRKGRLRRGETVLIEARFGGWRERVEARLRLRGRDAQVTSRADLGAARPSAAHPEARAIAAGTWAVPTELRPGRYTLEVEVQEGDDVSAMYREVVVE